MQMPIEKKWNKMKLERKDILKKTITIAGEGKNMVESGAANVDFGMKW
jgi:hypothetical protein